MTIAAATTGWSGAALAAATHPTIRTDRGCYLVGQRVKITGKGFAAARSYDVAVDGIDFGQSTTDVGGVFSSSLIPGGLGAGQAQHVHHLDVTDGTTNADASFTLTRTAGARFLASRGNPNTLRAPFEIWGFSLDGKRRALYLHYVDPGGHVKRSVALGHAGGQCGYLRTGKRAVFPFSPSVGTWTLQVDTSRRYAQHPTGPHARIRVGIA